MNERLTIQDLTDLLAAKHSMTKKDAEVFVKEFFLLIEQALENEKTVKIKGLGTFKLIDVDSRESVNVNTGERFQIKGHTKVSFSPDANLRDTINKPFAHFETVVLNENTVLEDTPVEEVEEEEVGEEILASTIEDYNKKEESQENTSNPIVENESQIAEQDSSEEVDTVQEERITEQSIEEKVVVEESLMVEQQQPEQPVKEKEKITAEQIIEQELLKANEIPYHELTVGDVIWARCSGDWDWEKLIVSEVHKHSGLIVCERSHGNSAHLYEPAFVLKVNSES